MPIQTTLKDIWKQYNVKGKILLYWTYSIEFLTYSSCLDNQGNQNSPFGCFSLFIHFFFLTRWIWMNNEAELPLKLWTTEEEQI